MNMTIKFKNGSLLELTGVYDTQSGEKYMFFSYKNELIIKGVVGIELEKIDSVRME